jgi:hypothetical protein
LHEKIKEHNHIYEIDAYTRLIAILPSDSYRSLERVCFEHISQRRLSKKSGSAGCLRVNLYGASVLRNYSDPVAARVQWIRHVLWPFRSCAPDVRLTSEAPASPV